MKMIDVHEFRILTIEEKCDLVSYVADYMHFRKSGETNIFLYALNDFFVEIFYCVRREKVLMVNAFLGLAQIDQYLGSISLDDLKQVLK